MLIAIKLLHTAIWAFFVACILAIPIEASYRRFYQAGVLIFVVLIECGVIALNKGRCPLTDLAASYTAERGDNFDIYLPLWLARHNKSIFGSLFVIAVVYVLLPGIQRDKPAGLLKAHRSCKIGFWRPASVSILRFRVLSELARLDLPGRPSSAVES